MPGLQYTELGKKKIVFSERYPNVGYLVFLFGLIVLGGTAIYLGIRKDTIPAIVCIFFALCFMKSGVNIMPDE